MSRINLPGGGVYVIGQEQDEAEGYFNVAESFIGTMSALHIWDRALTADEIQEAFWRSDVTGNLIAWSDFRSSVRGLVNILPSNFYQGTLHMTPAIISANITFIPYATHLLHLN